ncbi:MAG: cytochrome b [Hyphomicrobiales bacterium]|nr:cytochrome b [Hyphomicrobiales bacterium]
MAVMLGNTQTGYGLVAIVFHWTIAALFAGQVMLGIYMTGLADDEPAKFGLYQWHKSFGLVILLLALMRLTWRLANQAPHLPDSMRAWEQRAARLAHVFLYAAIVLVPVTGWALVSSSPLGIPTFAFYLLLVPHLPVPVSDVAEAVFQRIHTSLALISAAVAILHTGAALRHHFVLKDAVLRRMIVPARRERGQ